MNIMIINHYAGSPRHGMEYRHYYLAREYVRLGHKVSMVAGSYSHLRTENPVIKGIITSEEIDFINYIWLKTPHYQGNGIGRVLNMLAFSLVLLLLQSKIAGMCRPDLVIASSPHPFIIYGAKKIARSAGTRLMFEVRDLWPLTLIELGKISPRHPFIMMMQKAENDAYRGSDAVISLLPKADSYMQEHGMDDDKFIYIPNGISSAEWDEKVSSNTPTHHIQTLSEIKKKWQFIVGYAGSHGLSNALDTLIDAASLLQDQPVYFVLIGHGSDKEKLQQKAVQKGLQNISFLPSVPKSEIPGVLSLMDILYIGWKKDPLYRFGISPNKLMDYMMAGKPIINSADAGNDIVSESNCGITVEPENPQTVKDAVMKLIGMVAEEKMAMGARGRAYVLAHHDYSVLAKRILELHA